MQWIHAGKQQLHIELTSYCQANCPACSRVYDYTSHIQQSKLHSSWDIQSLKKVFDQDLLSNSDEVLLCGNYGDPLGSDIIQDFIEYVLHSNEKIRFVIHTNGGVGSRSTWEKLGHLLSGPGHQVKISIDGLEDTNHIYRRGVDWKTLMSNMSTFIEFGGHPHWKYIEFDHNRHQIDQAKKLASEIGFATFEVRPPYGKSNGHIDLPEASELPSDIQTSYQNSDYADLVQETFSSLEKFKSISCKVVENPSLYFDHEQRVWPCCWLAQDGDHRTRTMKRELFFREIFDKGVDKRFNDLKENSLLEILSHPFFQSMLPSSWSKDKINNRKCFATCLSTCGKIN